MRLLACLASSMGQGAPEVCVKVLNQDFTTVDPSALFPRRSGTCHGAKEDGHITREAVDSGGPGANPHEHGEEWGTDGKGGRSDCRGRRLDDPPHVIVGCCLADLLPPSRLALELLRLSQGRGDDHNEEEEEEGKDEEDECLVYLPITFAGKTEMHPSAPQARLSSIPSLSTPLLVLKPAT